MFPSNIGANMFGFKKEAFFEAPAEAKEAPKVFHVLHILLQSQLY